MDHRTRVPVEDGQLMRCHRQNEFQRTKRAGEVLPA
jgi:hypothetical protein